MTAPRPTVIDRVLADDHQSGDVVASVRRNVDALLNARASWRPIPPSLAATIRGYGLPDFTAGRYDSRAQKEALKPGIEAAIAMFEPRLQGLDRRKTVEAIIRPQRSGADPVLRLQIVGAIDSGQGRVPVRFESVVDTASTDMVVLPGDG